MAQVRASRSTVIGATVWLAVVLVCSTLVWTVISRAGEGVTADETPTRGQTTSTPRDTRTPASPSPTSPENTPGASDAVERTWSGTGGVVVVICRGAAAELGPARPNTGFAIEVDDTGPRRVQLEFEGQDDDDAKTRVRAWCVDGEPTFEVDSD